MAGAHQKGEAGFAAVDALTALVILSTTIALAIGALSSARKIQRAAAETSAARRTLQVLLAEPSRPPGDYAGVSGSLAWTLQVTDQSAPSAPIRICIQKAVVHPQAGGRRYALETRRTCPPDVR